MKLEDLQEMYDTDMKIDMSSLQSEMMNNVKIYSKWMKIYSDIKKAIIVHETSKKRVIKERLDYHKGYTDEVCMEIYEKSEMKTVLSADERVIKSEATLQYWLLLLDFATRALDGVKARSFTLKHILECRQYEAGGK